jgi:hypothetical protein
VNYREARHETRSPASLREKSASLLADVDFRYRNRIALGLDDQDRADKAIMDMVGKRLTYRGPDYSEEGAAQVAAASAVIKNGTKSEPFLRSRIGLSVITYKCLRNGSCKNSYPWDSQLLLQMLYVRRGSSLGDKGPRALREIAKTREFPRSTPSF